MTVSRALGIAAGAAGSLTVLATALEKISPKWGGILGMVALAITTFTERAHGSPEYRRIRRVKKAIRESESPPLPLPVTEDERAPGPMEK